MSQDPSGLHLFAIICERLGQIDLAIELLTQAIEILEAAYEETEDEKTERQFAIANVNLGRVRLGVANYAQAKEAFELVLGLTTETEDDPKRLDQDLSRLRAQARFGIGLANFKLGKLEDALASFETALEETPAELKDVQGHITILLAQTLWAIGGDEAQEAAKDQLLTW
jgi:superkiller protein 3